MQRINVNKLGVFLDGWAELIDGRSDAAEGVREYVESQLEAREMPDVATDPAAGFVNSTESTRPYVASSRYPGVTSTIFVSAHGEDLYVSWKTFQKLVPNWRRFGLLVLLSLLIGFLIPYLRYGLLFDLISGIISWILWLAFFLAAVIGLSYGAWWLYQKIKASSSFQQQVNLTPTMDKVFTGVAIGVALLVVLILVNIVSPPGRIFLPPVGGLLKNSIFIFLVVSFISFFFGILRHGHPLAYFFTTPTIFDADDTIALSLSVHKTVIHALDKAGIDTAVLHTRNATTKGRMAEEI